MRDLQTKSLRIRRYKRRLLLALVCMSATPVLADSPAAPSASIQSNPFFNAGASLSANDVHLASGQNQSIIRLKPIGKAIGLKSLSKPENKPALPQDVSRSKMTIESVPSLIQTNPLVRSNHREDTKLVDVDILPAQSPAASTSPQRHSTIMLMPSSSTPSVQKSRPVQKSTRSIQDSVRPVRNGDLAHESVPESPVVEPQVVEPTNKKPTATKAPVLRANSPQSPEPVRFSLSDRQRPTGQTTAPSDEIEPPVFESNAVESNAVESTDVASAGSNVRAMPAVAESLGPVQLKSAPESVAIPREKVQPVSPTPTRSDASIVSRQRDVATQNKFIKRYRPPVEVKSVPLQIERTATDESSTTAPVEVVPAFAPGSVAMIGKSAVAPTKLEMDLAQVCSLTLGGKLHTVKVADTSVCKVVATGSNQLKLIGTSEGITQLVVLAEGSESGKDPLQRTFQIHVTDAPQSTGHSLNETCDLLNRSVQETFPACEVLVMQRDNELMVAGRCDSQASAKKIMRMVRRTCLIPVRDELIVE